MNEQIMKTKKQVAGILILAILIAITFFFYLRGYSYRDLWKALEHANYRYLLAGLGMMFLFVSCEATNIYMITKVLGYKTPFMRCLGYSNIGFYFSAITPSASGGQPAQIYYMNKDKIPVTVSSITIFFIVFVYQIAMILLGSIMAVLRSSMAIQFITKLKYLFLFGVIANTAVLFLLFSLMFSKKLVPAIISFFIKIINKFSFLKKAEGFIEKLEQSVLSYHEKALLLKRHPVLFIKVLFVTMIQMTALNLIPSFVYLGMGNRADNILDLITCQSLLTISVSAVPLPGAEGVVQSGFLQVFDVFFKQDLIISAMLIQRVISFYIPLIISFLVYIVTQLRMMRQVNRGVLDGK